MTTTSATPADRVTQPSAPSAVGRIALELATAAPFQTIRAVDLAPFAARPSRVLAALARDGWLHRLARGAYCLVPGGAAPSTGARESRTRTTAEHDVRKTARGRPGPFSAEMLEAGVLDEDPRPAAGARSVDPFSGDPVPWPPTVEAAAIAVASTIHGHGSAVLSGLSAARLLGIWLPPLDVAFVTVPSPQRALPLDDHPGGISFSQRPLENLALETRPTDLGPALVTCPEQTMLDLEHADRLHRNPFTWSVIRRLGDTCDRELLDHLARTQRRRRTLDRILGLR